MSQHTDASQAAKTPIALTIAGSDSGGGAGVQADLKAFSALGVYGASVLTAITAQNTVTVSAVHEVPADIVGAQITAVLGDLDVDSIKIGMLFSVPIINVVAECLDAFKGTVILDPVMIAKSGDALLQADAVEAMKTHMLPRADLLTPNLPEAAGLLGMAEAQDLTQAQAQGAALLDLGPRAVLMKGGHSAGDICTDLLISDENGARRTDHFEAPRVPTHNTHGTGCTYSASIAAYVARGITLPEATQAAHTYLQGAIGAADTLQIGSGHGPVHHFYQSWQDVHS
ncbi:Hydroxymethylpyrimidine/phosphomethylpyrimidine kinase [Nereida ignava]|uniref:hydroxymethylpyrimidine kinase n=1 Tax=Nereida ignava TaxID=282199 RepID=A0A0U1NLV4_9RHOB|nr:bifunctional hydroxymethylpyrimidine kinase/phosphomethylpyrimidine kinase [Nereida ignava]CRK75694.1 Hydroxymethylpyrimidine/phosphomethylpyrimidine kinase [Nereida ignava]SFJ31995.1 hydroxymethylpyrimidine kinase /phosphomethylpyrimidine kinase [Nereida ignava DSM 16309]